MTEKILVIGGCRSGKSSYALSLAEQIPGEKRFIATCIPFDEEMKERVSHHQQDRSPDWMTIEAPIDLPGAILKHSALSEVVLADCLTLWISNLLMNNISGQELVPEINRLTHAIHHAASSVILVSNEVGTGIVPENALARLFRDFAGLSNQRVASAVNKVVWMVAGIPVVIKG
ncbi:MAG: bifunctional adenosylcobinamide kinase/adenosylcobinamide-phosphate guanylyltransferase [Pseudomonadota bacterium]